MKNKLNKWLYETIIYFMRKQAKLKKHTIDVNGYNIAYLEGGDSHKDTLIFIHGCTGSKDDWLTLAKELKEEYHLIMIDFLGAGESAKDFSFDYALRSQADLLETIIKQLTLQKKIERYSLCGTSSGGALAMLLANKLPIYKLILVNTFGLQVKASKIDMMAKEARSVDDLPWLNIKSIEQMKEMIAITFHEAPKIPNFILEYSLDKLTQEQALSKYKFSYFYDKEMNLIDDLSEDAKKIKQETLIVWGKEDNNINVASAYKADELIANSTLKIYETCGHAIPMEKPRELASDIIDFLENKKNSA